MKKMNQQEVQLHNIILTATALVVIFPALRDLLIRQEIGLASDLMTVKPTEREQRNTMWNPQ